MAAEQPFVWGPGGTPMTPSQIEAQRKVAQALMTQGMDYSPVKSPWQGAARVAQALLGGYESREADQSEKAIAAMQPELMAKALAGAGGSDTPAPVPSVAPTPSLPSAPVAAAPVSPDKIYTNDEPSPLDPPSGDDRKRMIATILGEAANEPQLGKQAVASVIRTRAVDGGYGGNTPSAVVTAPNQFEPWNTPDGRARMGRAAADPTQAAAADAAIAAAYGEGGKAPEDPTEGMTHFFSPGTQAVLGRKPPAWAGGDSVTIGGHVFNSPDDGGALPKAAQAAQGVLPSGHDVAAPAPAKTGVNPGLLSVINSPYASESTKKIAGAMLQAQLSREKKDTYSQQTDADGNIWSINNVTGQRTVAKAADKAPGSVQEYEYYKSNIASGKTPMDYETWSSKKARDAATNVTTNVDNKGEDSFAKAAGKAQADRFNDLAAEGQQAKQMVADLGTLTDLGKNIGTGKGAQIKAAIGPYADAIGVKIDGLSDIQAYEAIVNRVAPTLRVKGSGAQSDLELKNFLKSLPSLGNTPEGNVISSTVLSGLQENKARAAEIGSKALNGEISRSEAEKQLRDLPDPMEGYRAFMKSRPQSGTKPASDGWQTVGDGIRIREKK